MAERGMGRGLAAILQVSGQHGDRPELRDISIELVEPNPSQPRRRFEEASLEALAASLTENGVLQPILVRPREGGRYELVAGERRWRAIKDLGWKKVPAVVREVDERTLLVLALVENLQRASLSPIDEAEGYERLAVEFTLTHAEIAESVGKDRSTVANAVRLLKLPKAVRSLLDSGALSAGHARALLSLEDDREITRLAREAVAHGWSVRDTERKARGEGSKRARAKGAKRPANAPPEVRRIEEALRRRLGTDVAVVLNGKAKGHLSVRFFSQDDLARVLELILGRRWDG